MIAIGHQDMMTMDVILTKKESANVEEIGKTDTLREEKIVMVVETVETTTKDLHVDTTKKGIAEGVMRTMEAVHLDASVLLDVKAVVAGIGTEVNRLFRKELCLYLSESARRLGGMSTHQGMSNILLCRRSKPVSTDCREKLIISDINLKVCSIFLAQTVHKCPQFWLHRVFLRQCR